MARDSRGRFLPAAVELSLIDRLTAPLRRITKNWEILSAAGRRASRMFQISANLKQGADAIEDFTSKSAELVKKPIKTFMDLEETLSEVRAKTFKGVLTDETRKQFVALSAEARRLGATTSFSASEAAEGMVNLATAGFNAQEQIASMSGVLDIAAADHATLADAAEIGSSTLRGFRLEAREMSRVGDVLVNTFTSSQTTLADLGETMKYVAPVAAAAGVSLEKTAAMAGVLGDVGVRGSQAGTTLRAVIDRLQAPTSRHAKSALQFLGINPRDKKGNLRPIEDLLAEMQKAMDKKFGVDKGGARRAGLIKAIFGEEPEAGVLALLEASASGKLTQRIQENMKAAGTAARVAKDMTDNTAGAMKELDSAVEELQLTVGERLIPIVRDGINTVREIVIEVTNWTAAHPDLTKNLALVLGSLGAFGLVAGPVIKGISALTTVWGILTWGIGAAKQAWVLFKLALAIGLGPQMAVIAGIATAALLIYEYWEPISGFFSGLWDSVSAGFTRAFEWIIDKIQWAKDQVGAIKEALTGDIYVSERKVLEQQNALAGMSEADLQKLGNIGFFGDVAGDAVKSQRQVAAGAEKVAASIGPIGNLLPSMPSIGAANEPPAPSAPPLREAAGAETGQRFQGELKVTIDAEGRVKSTDMRQSGAPGFAVRANRGRQ